MLILFLKGRQLIRFLNKINKIKLNKQWVILSSKMTTVRTDMMNRLCEYGLDEGLANAIIGLFLSHHPEESDRFSRDVKNYEIGTILGLWLQVRRYAAVYLKVNKPHHEARKNFE